MFNIFLNIYVKSNALSQYLNIFKFQNENIDNFCASNLCFYQLGDESFAGIFTVSGLNLEN